MRCTYVYVVSTTTSHVVWYTLLLYTNAHAYCEVLYFSPFAVADDSTHSRRYMRAKSVTLASLDDFCIFLSIHIYIHIFLWLLAAGANALVRAHKDHVQWWTCNAAYIYIIIYNIIIIIARRCEHVLCICACNHRQEHQKLKCNAKMKERAEQK